MKEGAKLSATASHKHNIRSDMLEGDVGVFLLLWLEGLGGSKPQPC